MKCLLALVVGIGGLWGCSDESVEVDLESPSAALSVGPSLSFQAETGLSILEVLAETEYAYFDVKGTGLRTLVEIKAGYSGGHIYNLSVSYPSLSSLAQAMDAEDTEYLWSAQEFGGSTFLVVKPSTGAVLDTPVTNLVYSGTFCEVAGYLSAELEPKESTSQTCYSSGRPRFVAAQDAAVLMSDKVDVEVTSSLPFQEVVQGMVNGLSSPVGLTLFTSGVSDQLIWGISL